MEVDIIKSTITVWEDIRNIHEIKTIDRVI